MSPGVRPPVGQLLGRLLEAAGSTALFCWLLATGWQLAPDPRLSALLVAGWLLPRRAALLLVPRLAPSARQVAALLVVLPAAGALFLLPPGMPTQPLLLVLALGGVAGGYFAAERAHRSADQEAQGGILLARLGMVAGAVLASMLLLRAPELADIGGLVVLLAGWLLLGFLDRRRDEAADEPASARVPALEAPTRGFGPLLGPRPLTYVAAAFASGAVVAATFAWLPQLLVAGAKLDVALVGAAVALVGAGALVTLPVTRLRNRLAPVLLVSGLVAGLAAAAGLVALLGPLLVGLAVLPAVGLLAASLDIEQLVELRRSGADTARRLAWLVAAFGAGQLAGALTVVALGTRPDAVGGPVVVVALAAAALAGVALLLDRRSLGAIRHQVQQFSWNADPPPRAFEQPPPGSRAARLSGWVQRQVGIELVDVSLPVSGRRYAISRPSGDGRDSLFEQAKADPERQMPYWAKVWPSGVALADLVVERADEVRGRQVLELGAGLGVTACTVLEEGGRLITADYSLLALALCRLNGLLNTGRGPGSICFNWRDEAQVQDVLRRHPPIGLILAADVLYEFRDIGPLIEVIERLLAPGGSLWLAEPVRRTAQRFLDTVAAMGWTIDSRRIRASWPDATDGWVNVHVIRREGEPTELVLGLAGGQL